MLISMHNIAHMHVIRILIWPVPTVFDNNAIENINYVMNIMLTL